MVGIGAALATLDTEVQLIVAGADVAAFDLKQSRISAAGHTEHNRFAGADGRTGDHTVQIEDHHNTPLQPVFIAGDGHIQHTVMIAHALINEAGQVQIRALDVDLVLADGTQLGHADGGIGGTGTDRAGVQIHAPLGDEGNLTTAHTLDGHGSGTDILTVALQTIGCNFGQVAAVPPQANDGIGPLLGGGNKEVGFAVNAPDIHIVGMIQVIKHITTGITVVHSGGLTGIFIRHGDKGLGIVTVDLDGVDHLRTHRNTLNTGAGIVVSDLCNVRVLAIERTGCFHFVGQYDHGCQKQDQ